MAKFSFQDNGHMTCTSDQEPCTDGNDALNAVVNYMGILSLVDPMDKSAVALLRVILDLMAEKKINGPTEAEHLFSIYLARRRAAALSAQPLPTYADLKAAHALAGPPPKDQKRKRDRSDQPNNNGKRGNAENYCYNFLKYGTCNASDGVSCQKKGKIYLHACNRRLPGGVKCNGHHAPDNCPNK